MLSLDKTDRVIINLKVIGTLQHGQRVCVRNGQFSVYPDGWGQALTRWLYSENRWVNYEDVQTVVNEAICILNTYMNMIVVSADSSAPYTHTPSSALASVATLTKEIAQASLGLQCLKQTYATDPLMVATLDVLMERADAEIAKARALLQKHDVSVPGTPATPATPATPVLTTSPAPKPPTIERTSGAAAKTLNSVKN
jgi:hypothetical protein